MRAAGKVPKKVPGRLQGRFQEGSERVPRRFQVMHAQRACQNGAMGNKNVKVMNGNGECEKIRVFGIVTLWVCMSRCEYL